MELSPELFDAVTFRERWRGYDPEEVEDFLDRVSDAVAILHSRLIEANQRISAAEARTAERADADDAVRRTLVLAQKTADDAVSEAERRAAAITSDAERNAEALGAEAEARATEIEAGARRRAAEIAADAQRQLREDLTTLESARMTIQADVDALRTFLSRERDRLRVELRRHLDAIDDPASLRMGSPPQPSRPSVPAEPVVDAQLPDRLAGPRDEGSDTPDRPRIDALSGASPRLPWQR